MRARLAGARVVALPVRENSYSGATTVLLQAMALAKPVVVTRTRAIATGYGLVDGENCRLVAPGDDEAFERSLAELLGDEEQARAIGVAARTTVERDLSWQRYVDRLQEALLAAAGAPPVPALSARVSPAAVRCAASSSASQGAHGWVSTNSSSTHSHAVGGVSNTALHSSPSMFTFTTSLSAASASARAGLREDRRDGDDRHALRWRPRARRTPRGAGAHGPRRRS